MGERSRFRCGWAVRSSSRALLPWQVPVMTVTMLREVKFSSATAHGCAVTVLGPEEVLDSTAQLRQLQSAVGIGLPSLSRPRRDRLAE